MVDNKRSLAERLGLRRERIEETRASTSTLDQPSSELIEAITLGATLAGEVVTTTNAMRYAAVSACVKIISESIAALPLIVYRVTPDGAGKERAPDHPLFRVLHDAPNDDQTPFEFWSLAITQILLHGNTYSVKEIDGAGRVAGLQPLLSDRTRVQRDKSGKLVFDYQPNQTRYLAEQIFRIHGHSTGGILGESVIGQARQYIGTGKAAEKYSSKFFSNGARVDGVLTSDNTNEDRSKRVQKQFDEFAKGADNAHKTAMLPPGVKFIPISIDPKDAELISTRRFEIQEIARMFRVPLHLLQDLERSTNNNIEQQSLDFLTHTLGPWISRIEQAIRRDLMTPEERKFLRAEFLTDKLIKVDTPTRIQAIVQQIEHGLLTPNEARALENRNPVEGGDHLLVSQQVQTLDRVVNAPALEPSASEPEDRAVDPIQERRFETRGVPERVQLAERSAPFFQVAAAKLVDAEVEQLRALLKDEPTGAQLRDAVEELYKTFPETVREAIAPTFQSFAAAIRSRTAQEINLKEEPDLSDFLDKIIKARSVSWSESSRVQLETLIDENPETFPEEVEGRLLGWEETRAEKFGRQEARRTGNAVARSVFLAGGVTALIWRTQGKNCPLCDSLDGRVVGILSPFLEANDTVEGDESTADLTTTQKVRGPPLHQSCNCYIDPE